MMPYLLFPGFLTFLYIDWEARNCIPAGTIQRAVTSGGENSPSLKYSRGELTTVEFLQELGQECFEIVSQLPLPLFVLPDCRERGSCNVGTWWFSKERGAFKINPSMEGFGFTTWAALLSDRGRLLTAVIILLPRQDGEQNLPSLPPASSSVFHNFLI